MQKFQNLFDNKKPVIGMIHVAALPGTPKFSGSVSDIITKAKKEAELYKNAGISALMIENMHDIPYLNRNVGHEISTLMAIVGYEIKNQTKLPCGIQILAGANFAALACAKSAGLDFIRSEGFVFAHVADEGIMQSDAGELKRFQKLISAENILIFNDIKKKHSSHSITNDVDIVETAKAAEFFMSDGVIITGTSTGKEAEIKEVKDVKANVKIPVLVGSGITDLNILEFYNNSDGLIIGSYFKQSGYWQNDIDIERVNKIIKKIS
jgi:membrane complex biogenesis BtpA family protein